MDLLQLLTALVTCYGIATCRDSSKMYKPLKSMPSITHSLVNLGKIDISFHFNPRNMDLPTNTGLSKKLSSNSFIWNPETTKETSCPCYNNQNTSPYRTSSILSKILKSNDLFSSNILPKNSMACCESREEIEETNFLEVGPKMNQSPINSQFEMNQNPINTQFKNFLSTLSLGLVNPIRTPRIAPMRSLDIFLMPVKKELSELNNNKHFIINDIQAVGNKRNEFKWMPLSPLQSSSVKKDLTTQEKIENIILNQKDGKEQDVGKTEKKNDEKVNQV